MRCFIERDKDAFLCIFSDSFAILAAYCLELPTNSVSIYVYLSINGKKMHLNGYFVHFIVNKSIKILFLGQ